MRIPRNVFGAGLRPFIVLCVLTPSAGLLVGAISQSVLVGHIAAMLVFFLMFLDVTARVLEYISIYHRYQPLPPSIVCTSLQRSFCGRGVAIALYGDYARKLFKTRGYPTLGIMPDGYPSCFFKASFWKTVVGITRKFK